MRSHSDVYLNIFYYVYGVKFLIVIGKLHIGFLTMVTSSSHHFLRISTYKILVYNKYMNKKKCIKKQI